MFNTDSNEDSFGFLTQVNERCEFFWQLYAKSHAAILVLITTTSPLSIINCCIITGKFDAAYAFHPHKVT